MIDRLKEALDARRDEYLNYLIDLVEIDTQHLGQGIDGGLEYAGQEYFKQLAESIGASKTTLSQMEEKHIEYAHQQYGEGNLGHNYENRQNLYIYFDGQPSEYTLMFNGHMDTMPPGNLDLWDTDPHKASIKDGKLYGLGAADMKAGLMASLLAVKLIQDAQQDLPINVVISSVVDEEGGGNGSIQAALELEAPDGVVVCEGTDYELNLAHMGFVFYRITVTGRANHSGAKWKGVDAFKQMQYIVSALEEMEYEWLFQYKHKLLPPPNFNIGVVRGGSSGATVPADCMIELCIHYHPGTMSLESVQADIDKALERAQGYSDWLQTHPPHVEIFQAGNGFEMEEDSDLVQGFVRAFQEVQGSPPKIVGSPAGCDSRLWRNIAQAPTIQFGPGRLSECHSPNEFVRIDEYFTSILIYAQLILEMKEGA